MPLWLHWIVLGFVAGALAKFLVPGRDPAGCIVTVALGLAGAFLGGWIGSRLGWGRVTSSDFSPRSIALATFGAVLLLVLGRLVFRRAREE
ncbi:MAG TPA: GlsB/YeaQ/YmgE family stress response membrane protein [Gemmatimonadaceae bacterium]